MAHVSLLAQQQVLERFGLSHDSTSAELRQEADLSIPCIQLYETLHDQAHPLGHEVVTEVSNQQRLQPRGHSRHGLIGVERNPVQPADELISRSNCASRGSSLEEERISSQSEDRPLGSSLGDHCH